MQTVLELNHENEDADRQKWKKYFLFLNQSYKKILNSNCSHHKKDKSIILPKIDLPKFNGSYEDWLTFSEFFRAVVHDNENLTVIQKFYYLTSSLTDSALQIIKNLSVTADNYTVAWKLLETRFANKQLIASIHAREILNVQSIPKESASGISNFIDTISSNINALKALKLKTNYPELVLTQLFVQRLDQATIRAWESTISTDTFPDIDQFISFLERRRQILESSVSESQGNNSQKYSVDSRCTKQYNQFKRDKDFKSSQKIHAHAVSIANSECPYCKQPHLLYKCSNFLKLPVNGRISFVKKHRL